MIVCGLDQAPSGTGFCYGDGSGTPTWGYVSFNDYGDNTLLIIQHVGEWFKTFAKSAGIERVCTEQIIAKANFRPGKKQPLVNMPVLHRQYAVVAGITYGCALAGLRDHDEATIGEWRMSFLELAQAPKKSPDGWLKDRARLQCLKRGWLVDNHHTAEAIGIWDWYLAEIDRNYRQRRGPDHRRAMLAWQNEAA